jgi:glutamine synthetase
MIVCFLPKSSEDSGNGCHIHMSLWKDGKNITGDKSRKYGISEAIESFMAGILSQYSALFHFLCPSINSMRRIMPTSCVGAYKFWGIENKEAPLRLL